MVVVCDINEVWRKKPFAALAGKMDVLGVSPADWLVAHRRGNLPQKEGAMEILPVALPPSWASSMAWLGQRLLWKGIVRKCKAMGKTADSLVLTSPHYLPMLDMVPTGLKTFYYASDDYRSYEGWGKVADLEKEMVRRVDHAFFVSEGLMERARREYGVDQARLSVSMNATEPRFFPMGGTVPVPPPGDGLKRPIAGVVGGINDRLDFSILLRCADLPELGTLLLVGPLPSDPPEELKRLLGHPKCVAVGRQPHETIHQWFQCLDVGLIPYVKTEFNRFCSPMRLFDHMASGVPLVVTDACDQVRRFSPQHLTVCTDAESFGSAVAHGCSVGGNSSATPRIRGISWDERAAEIQQCIEYVSAGQTTSHAGAIG